jgi:inward rectifier potassium channel
MTDHSTHKHQHSKVKRPANLGKSQWRFLNRDGTFNVERVDRPRRDRHSRDLYHRFLSLHWREFFAAVAVSYFLLNLLFGLGYFIAGPHALSHTDGSPVPDGLFERFSECFFFSVQTLATIGYGKLVPNSMVSNFLVTVEAFIGLLIVALMTGLVFARFSRPTARVVFSRDAVINFHDGVPSLLFRLANLRANQIVEAGITVVFARNEKTIEGDFYRNFYDLELEREKSPMFVLSWTVVHPITADSPLHGMTRQDMFDQQAEILILMTGWDETFAQTIHARNSYAPEEILWNHRFKDMIDIDDERGKLLMDVRKISEVEPIPV